MYTNKMRMTGFSGLDTESMISQLMKAESMKLNKYKQTNQLTLWKQEAYRSVSSQIKTFQNNFLSFTTNSLTNMRSVSSFRSIAGTVKLSGTETTSSAVSIKTSGAQKSGTTKLDVKQVASIDKYISTDRVNTDIKANGELNVSQIAPDDVFRVALDGVSADISFSQSELTAIGGDKDKFVAKLNEKLTNSFKTETIGGTTSSKVTAGLTEDGKLTFSTSALHSITVSTGNTKQASVTGSTLSTDVSGFSGKKLTVTVGNGEAKEITLGDFNDTTSHADLLKDINTKLSGTGVSASLDKDGKLVFNNTNRDSAVTITGDALDLTGMGAVVNLKANNTMNSLGFSTSASQTNKLNLDTSLEDMFPAVYNDEDELISGVKFDGNGEASFTINNHTFTFDRTDSIKKVMNDVNNANIGVKMSFDSGSGKFALESTKTGLAAEITFGDDKVKVEGEDDFQHNLLSAGFGFNNAKTNNATRVSTAKDAVFTLGDFETTRASNTFTIDGVEYSLTEAAEGKTYDIEFKGDTSKTMDMVKKFVEEYNKLIDTLTGFTSTPRAKNGKYSYYEPLTDDQKSEMKDADIANWEKKAKEGVLYRDELLNTINRQMRGMLYDSVGLDNGSTISLFQIGITTSSNVNDYGKLVLDEKKLQDALDNRGEDVATLFTKSSQYEYSDKANSSKRMKEQGIAERLNDIFNNAVDGSYSMLGKKAGLAGTQTTGNSDLGKILKKQYEDIDNMIRRLSEKENNYYIMFSKLESQMTQANSQMSYLQSVFSS